MFFPHIVGILNQLGQGECPHECGKIIGDNLAKENLHSVATLVDYPLLIAAQLHGAVKILFEFRETVADRRWYDQGDGTSIYYERCCPNRGWCG